MWRGCIILMVNSRFQTMHPSLVRVAIFAILCCCLVGCAKPLLVTHWTAKDAALLKKPKSYGWPAHKWYSRVVCFNELCRKKAAWVKKQRNDRFKGFKDGGKLPPPQPKRLAPDTSVLVLKSKPVEIKTEPSIDTPAQVITASQPKRDSLIVLNEVLFAVNSYKLRPELFPKLDSIVSFLTKNPSTRIEISGHTDNTGKEDHNLRLSENRADAVAEYLVDRGVATSRVSFNGYGSSRPVAPNNNEEGRRKNRRVEILIHNRD